MSDRTQFTSPDKDAQMAGSACALVFSHASDAMLLLRVQQPGPNGSLSFIIQAANPSAAERIRSFGHADNFLEKNIDDVFPNLVQKKARAEYKACVNTATTRRYKITPPGGAVTLESIATPVLNATREYVTHIVVITRDIVEHVRHERELADALWQAQQANKSKAEFLASMSHELRTPLNAVLGYSEMLQREIGGALTDKHKEYAAYIHQSGSHLLKIIGDILDLSKIEAGKFTLAEEETHIQPLIAECVSMVRERAVNKGLQLRTEIPEKLPSFRIDPLRLKQIILNLLSNAIKFTPEGSVTLTLSFDNLNGLIITIRDTGVGMSPAEVRKALEPFGQVESALTRNHDGTGLGLPIAMHLVALHGGDLSLVSEPGRGTSVVITLPVERGVVGAETER
jgi:signal transduction histidine kinase